MGGTFWARHFPESFWVPLIVPIQSIEICINPLTYMTNTKIPGLSFSWKRAIGITKIKREFTKATGIPTTKSGVERKIGSAVVGTVLKLFK